MAKFAMASLALLTAIGGGALAHGAPVQDMQSDAASPYAVLVSKMDHAYNMQFKVPVAPEETAARNAQAKPAG